MFRPSLSSPSFPFSLFICTIFISLSALSIFKSVICFLNRSISPSKPFTLSPNVDACTCTSALSLIATSNCSRASFSRLVSSDRVRC